GAPLSAHWPRRRFASRLAQNNPPRISLLNSPQFCYRSDEYPLMDPMKSDTKPSRPSHRQRGARLVPVWLCKCKKYSSTQTRFEQMAGCCPIFAENKELKRRRRAEISSTNARDRRGVAVLDPSTEATIMFQLKDGDDNFVGKPFTSGV